MYLRQWIGVVFSLLAVGLCGCVPTTEIPSDEQKNEYFILGKERTQSHDYKGAIEAFEKAVELNPRSVLAHFELAVLYEQHGDQKENDYVAAMYHYLQVIKLRPNEYPAENARQRVHACKQELVKAESLAPVAQGLIRELDRLKEENQSLRKQLEVAKAQLANRALPLPGPDRTGALTPTTGVMRVSADRSGQNRSNPQANRDQQHESPIPVARTHTVKPRETMASIARQYHVNLTTLLDANPRIEPKRLKPGQMVTIPKP